MTQPTVRIAKLNNDRYEHGILRCFVRAKLYGDNALVDVTAREAETRQLSFDKARTLAEALHHATN